MLQWLASTLQLDFAAYAASKGNKASAESFQEATNYLQVRSPACPVGRHVACSLTARPAFRPQFVFLELYDGQIFCAIMNHVSPASLPRLAAATDDKRANFAAVLTRAAELGMPELFDLEDAVELKEPELFGRVLSEIMLKFPIASSAGPAPQTPLSAFVRSPLTPSAGTPAPASRSLVSLPGSPDLSETASSELDMMAWRTEKEDHRALLDRAAHLGRELSAADELLAESIAGCVLEQVPQPNGPAAPQTGSANSCSNTQVVQAAADSICSQVRAACPPFALCERLQTDR